MTFLDVLHLRSVGDGALSKDGQWFAYAISSLDWKEGKRFTDLYLTQTSTGEMRRLTFTEGKDESSPAFSPDSRSLAFLSNRDGTRQLYLLALDGGEARKLTAAKEGVQAFRFSPDGKYLALLAGRSETAAIHLWRAGSESHAEELYQHPTGISAIEWSPDSGSLFFKAPDELDKTEKKRLDLKFDVRIVDRPQPPQHLWELVLDGKKTRRLTAGAEFSVDSFEVARSGGWIGFRSTHPHRHEERVATRKREAWLLHAPSGKLERLTDNAVSESAPTISPDGTMLALAAPDEFAYFRRQRIYVRPTNGGAWRKMPGGHWDHDAAQPEWSRDGNQLYFATGIGTTQQAFSIDVAGGGQIGALTSGKHSVSLNHDSDTGLFIATLAASDRPADYFLATRESLSHPASWKRLSHANPQIADFALGVSETVTWKSTDGASVEGILVKPVGYEPGKRYPLIVQIHGGPASAVVHSFSGSWSSYHHVFAAGGYAVLSPNYRGSTNYGEKFRTSIVGNYFPQAFDDIMTGVDHLIAAGIADPDKLGLMGWSAGGHWSNWALTHTKRFKAISSGAGAANWVSMYAQNDSQANREHYFQGTPYDNWDHWVAMSPIRHIRNASTPTLIHCGHDDPRVPRPQSEELHMALKKLGVPTEFIVYPRQGHGLTEPRLQMVKMASEYAWFEKWIRGRDKWIDWQELIESVPGAKAEKSPATDRQ